MWHSPVAIGLLASRKMRTGQCAPLVQFVRVFEPFFRDVLQAHIVAVGRTYDVIKKSGGLHGYPHFERHATEEAGGIVSLVRRVVEPAMAGGVDWIIDLSDPIDPTALYPEVQRR